MSEDSFVRRLIRDWGTRHWGALFFSLAALGSTLALLGWVLDIPRMRATGFDGRPIWPLTALGYLCLSTGLLAAFLERRRLAGALLAVPLVISLLSWTQWLLGVDFGTDRLLFQRLVTLYGVPNPGRPGPTPSTVLLLLSAAGIISMLMRQVRPNLRSLIASALFAASGGASLLLLLTRLTHPPEGVPDVSRAAIAQIFFLILGFGMYLAEAPWVRALAGGSSQWTRLRLLLPLAIFLPVLPSLGEKLFGRVTGLGWPWEEMFVVGGNVVIVAGLTFWAAWRIGEEQAEIGWLSQALEGNTIAVVDGAGKITHWSRGCEQLYGWTAEEAIGRNIYLLLNAACGLGSDPSQARAAEAEGRAIGMIEHARDGRELVVLERTRLVDVPGRDPAHVLEITDVTQEVRAVEALRISEERLALATSAHELGVFEWNVADDRIEFSPGTEQRVGIHPGSISSFDTWRAQVEPADMQDVLTTIARAVREKAQRFSFRFRLRSDTASGRTIEGSSRAFYDAHGNLVRTVGVMLDTTARDEREAELRRREAQLRSILETVPDAMLVVDEQGRILQFSAAAEALWGYRAPDVIGQLATMLIPEEDRNHYLNLLSEFLATGDGVIGEVIRGTAEAANGHRFPIEARSGIAQIDGKVMLTIFVRDMSDQLATDQRLSELSAEIAHVSRQSAMSELAADLAHELNQPLSATSNFLAAARMLIERGETSERVTDLLRMGSEQTQRAGEIIRRLRAFMARGEVEMRAESVARTIGDAVDLVLVGTRQFGIRVIYDLDPEAPFIFADRIQVQQVLVNLLRNASEALRNSASGERLIAIASRRLPNQMVEISVSDTGPGIPQQVLEQIFARFTTTKSAGGGMGIGLSISKRIIEAHGGKLSAENRPEGGARFCFTLPTVEEGTD